MLLQLVADGGCKDDNGAGRRLRLEGDPESGQPLSLGLDMRQFYWTLAGEGRSEYCDRKSEFIGFARPIKTGSEADDFVAEVRREYADARHHVYAWRVGGDETLQKYSDDGEPRGTGGMPVLDILLQQKIDDAAIVVVRYFGGILLGTGGLVKAYSTAAAEAVKAAVPCLMVAQRLYKITVGYGVAEKLRYQLAEHDFYQTEPDYAEIVSWQAGAVAEREEQLMKAINDVTSGGAAVEFQGVAYRRRGSLPTTSI